MNKEPLLKVDNLKTHFNTATGIVKAVDGVTFSLDSGQTLGIVGESGCGKSVTSSSIMRLLPKNGHIVEGSILFEGKDIVKLSQKEMLQIRGNDISMIFQDPMTALDPVYTIGSQIMEVINAHQKMSKAEAKEYAVKVLKMVGIPEAEKRLKSYPHEFSGGMRQRVVIAIAIACRPKILICDEPTTALDVTIQAQILELLKDLKERYNLTIIFITHDFGVVANIADRVAVMYAGDIVETGMVREVFYDPRHPYTWALLSSLPQLGVKGQDLYSIKGTPPNLFNEIKGDAFAPRNPQALAIDFEEQPPYFDVSPTHKARTWLLDPRAPKVEPPEHLKQMRAEL